MLLVDIFKCVYIEFYMNEHIRVSTDVQKKGIRLSLKFRGDLGSNIMDAFQGDNDEVVNEWLAEEFYGYESQDREPITIEMIERFIVKALESPKIRPFSSIFINIMGSLDFSHQPRVIYTETLAKQPPKRPHYHDHDKRGQKYGGRRG